MKLELLIPVFNEQEAFPSLCKRIDAAFTAEKISPLGISEIIVTFIDDGSRDKTLLLIREYIKTSSFNCRLVKLSRNFGHQSAVSAGLSHSHGDYVAVMDADLQDPPEIILDMFKEIRTGFDVIYGVRKERKEAFYKKFSYWAFYRIYKYMSAVNVPLDAGDFCLMSRRAVDAVNSLGESIRFPRGIRAWIGFNQKGYVYERQERTEGVSKYSLRDLIGLAANGITAFSVRPLELTQYLTAAYFFCSMFFTLYFVFRFFNPVFLQRDTLVILASVSVSNMFLMGILHIHGSYLGRTYLESKQRPNFIVEEISSNEV